MTYRELYEWGKENLISQGIEEAQLDARLLLEFVCKTKRSDLLAHGDRSVEVGSQEQYKKLIGERGMRVPLQYLTSVQNFMGLEFAVDKRVLIPRQDTEILVEEVLKNLHDGMRVLDLCTGSGCILISLLCYTNNCEGVGVDLSEDALKVAGENAARLLGAEAVDSEAEGFRRIQFRQGDLFEAAEGKFDVIVSNPPYIRSAEIKTLMPEVREHEPRQALDGGEDGLLFYRRIAEGSRQHLFGGGMLFLEIGYDQAEAVSGLLGQAGFQEIHVVKDYGGLDRVVYGTLSF